MDPGRVIIGFRMWGGEDGNYSEVLKGRGAVSGFVDRDLEEVHPTNRTPPHPPTPPPRRVCFPTPHSQRLMLTVGEASLGGKPPLPSAVSQ